MDQRTVFILGLCGIIWVYVFWQFLAALRARSWPTAPAVVVEVQTMTVKKSNAPDRIVRAPLLRFQVPERGQVQAVPDHWTTTSVAQMGEQVTVRYHPDDPERVQVVGLRASGTVLLLVLLIAIPAFAALFLSL
jgi:hypothetical protein